MSKPHTSVKEKVAEDKQKRDQEVFVLALEGFNKLISNEQCKGFDVVEYGGWCLAYTVDLLHREHPDFTEVSIADDVVRNAMNKLQYLRECRVAMEVSAENQEPTEPADDGATQPSVEEKKEDVAE